MIMNMLSLRLIWLMIALPVLVADAQAKDALGVRGDGTSAIGVDPYGPDGVYAEIPERDEFGRDQLAMFREWNPDPVGRHDVNLNALNPLLAKVLRRAQADNPELRFVIGSGRRDQTLQQKALEWGWSRTRSSPHQSGNAVDVWPLDARGRVRFDPEMQHRIGNAIRQAAAQLGIPIRWGGSFHSFKNMDRSHFELVSFDRRAGAIH
jgi:peptidoglycan LD-endopeptidase CwlK